MFSLGKGTSPDYPATGNQGNQNGFQVIALRLLHMQASIMGTQKIVDLCQTQLNDMSRAELKARYTVIRPPECAAP